MKQHPSACIYSLPFVPQDKTHSISHMPSHMEQLPRRWADLCFSKSVPANCGTAPSSLTCIPSCLLGRWMCEWNNLSSPYRVSQFGSVSGGSDPVMSSIPLHNNSLYHLLHLTWSAGKCPPVDIDRRFIVLCCWPRFSPLALLMFTLD